jgi:hypothetical protein
VPGTSVDRRTEIENGTNVISETSFVINILKKKQRKTKTAQRERIDFTFEMRNDPSLSNTSHLRKPATTVIKLNSNASVFQSIYFKYSELGFTKKQVMIAAHAAMQNTISFLQN